jgi:hypothetical protein
MATTIESLAADCRRILSTDPGPAGRRRVAAAIEVALKDHGFVAHTLTDDLPERKVLYEDPDLGFCILGHNYKGPKASHPHDHGPSWAIYGQAAGETLMDDFALVEPAAPDRAGKVRHTRRYKLTPGMAHVYDEGDLHAPTREGPTKLLRIEGTNMDRVSRLSYEAM